MHPVNLYHAISAPHDLRVNSITKPITFRINAVAGRYFFIAYYFLGVLIPCFYGAYSLFLVSMQMVTGPSLSSSTFMSAPNSPVPTGLPRASESLLQNSS